MSIREVRHLTKPEQQVMDRALRRSVTIVEPPAPAVASLVREGVDISGGAKDGCHLVWWPDELPAPVFGGEPGTRLPVVVACPECERRREYSKRKMSELRGRRKGGEVQP